MPFPPQRQRRPGLESKMVPRPRYLAPAYHAARKLEGKAALITGADSGIGRAVAVLYAREGADVAILYHTSVSDAEETRRQVEAAGGKCLLIRGDVTEPDSCENAVEATVREFGKLDILVNNAGYERVAESIKALSEEQWDKTFRINIYGYFHMTKAALPFMKKGATIINTGSVTGFRGNKSLLDYSATKGAIHAFTKSLAQNLADRGIRVNCVAPGPVWTPLVVSATDDEDVKDFGKDVPLHRPAQPEEIAPAYVFFASEADSSYITGEVLPILGGETVGG